MSGRNAGVAFTLLTMAVRVGAQAPAEPGHVCLKDQRPRPTCSAIIETNFGGYAIAGTLSGSSRLRVGADWGVMVPTGTRSAVGASLFGSLDDDGVIFGPSLRYRRWSSDQKSSIELAIGTPLSHQYHDASTPVFGLIKWNSNKNVAIALRPELRRLNDYDCTYVEPYTCTPITRKGLAISVGVEISGVPGLIAAGAAGFTFLGLLLAYASSAD